MGSGKKKQHFGMRVGGGLLLAAFLGFSAFYGTAEADTAPDKADLQECFLQALETVPGNTTVDELRARCQAEQMAAAEKKKDEGIVEQRIYTDDENMLRPFTLMAHRQNYILLANYNPDPNNEVWWDAGIDQDNELDKIEAQFQVSIKVPLAVDLFDDKLDIFAAYTVRSFWQVYNEAVSAPFRETNYEPEGWLQFRPNWSFWGIKNVANAIGINHQSNGRNEPISRSWNRIFAAFIFEKDNLVFTVKPWYRIPEDDEDDNNPDLTDYMGHYELRLAYKWRDHTFSLMSRNNIESGFSRGAVEGTWSFPLWDYKYLKGFVQGFSGYGQSLIDYNVYQKSIGIGFAITDFL